MSCGISIRRRRGCMAAAIAAFTALCAARSQAAPQVLVSEGVLKGQQVKDVQFFGRIPFAAPPTGALRWRAPRPAIAWQGTRSAAQTSPLCVQPKSGNVEAGVAEAEMSEDCLYLNIWRQAASGEARLPVMVWIHGGAFRGGGGALPLYDGTRLARRGVIVVTINYRLGPLGTFSLPGLRDEAAGEPGGNFGLLDQIAALHWVRANIAAFGGDPGNVTVFGESAGGASTLYLAASPMANGLFKRAIVQSGALDLSEPSQAEADAIGLAMTRRVAGEKASGSVADLARLRALPAEHLMQMPGQRTDTMPFIDGRVVTRPMQESYARGTYSKIDLLIGRNSDEAGFFPPPFYQRLPSLFGSEWPAVRKLVDPSGQRGETWAARQLAGDLFAGTGTRAVASAVSAGGGTVYQYFFDHVPPESRASGGGAIHTADLPFVFGTLPAGSSTWAAEVSRRMSDLWTSFAKNGVPSAQGVPAWPRYDAQRRLLIIGDDEFTVGKDPAEERLILLDRPRMWHIN